MHFHEVIHMLKHDAFNVLRRHSINFRVKSHKEMVVPHGSFYKRTYYLAAMWPVYLCILCHQILFCPLHYLVSDFEEPWGKKVVRHCSSEPALCSVSKIKLLLPSSRS